MKVAEKKMAKKRGGVLLTGPGPGRPKGVPNKITVEFRETVQKLLDGNRDNVSVWLSQVAKKDPARALDLIAKLAEYAAPKLTRTELSGPNGGPVPMCDFRRVIVDPKSGGDT